MSDHAEVIEQRPATGTHGDGARSTDADDSGLTTRPVTAPLPAWERHLPRIYLVTLAIAIVLLAFVPQRVSPYNLTLILTVLLTISLSTSWNIISGFAGYTSFGHAGFFGIGSYVGALLLFNEVMPWILAMIVAGLSTALVALIIGYPALRLRGPYFAITMLGLSEIARIVTTAWESVTRGGIGVYLPILRDSTPNYYAMLIVTVIAVVVSYFVGSSRFGLVLRSIRDDEVAAQSMGLDTTRAKLAAFTLSSFFPGIAGAIYARHVGFIDPVTVFAVIWSIRAITTAILGGQGTFLGPIIGAIVLTLVSETVWSSNPFLYQVIFGGLIVGVVLFLPGGLMELMQRFGWLPRSRRL